MGQGWGMQILLHTSSIGYFGAHSPEALFTHIYTLYMYTDLDYDSVDHSKILGKCFVLDGEVMYVNNMPVTGLITYIEHR